MSKTYADFLVQESKIWRDLSDREAKILKIVYLQQTRDTLVTVTDLLQSIQLGSPATIHHSLQELRGKGLIIYAGTKQDQRIRLVRLTNRGKKIFESLTKAFGAET
jgi:DNA-binding MarR family transcriptional regulator